MRIFVSSPSDLAAEREIAVRTIARLRSEFQHHFDVQAVVWEQEPLLATAHFQEGLVSPAECDVAVCMFWSTLGSPLPVQFKRPDGTTGVTGTEWEFRIAREAHQRTGKPEILVYRKTAPIELSVRDHAAVAVAQHRLSIVDEFFDRNFHNDDADKTIKAAYWPFEDTNSFEEQLLVHLSRLLRRHASRPSASRDQREIAWIGGSPFRGLKSFEFEHAEVFFGRSAARNEMLHQFRQQVAGGAAFLMVLGASGSGKSSLVKAGLLPLLVNPHVVPGFIESRWCIFKPSDSPRDLLRGVTNALKGEHCFPELASQMDAIAATSVDLVVARVQAAIAVAKGTAPRNEKQKLGLLLVVDQFEELFSHPEISPSQRGEFVTLLSSLLATGEVWVIATMRSDYFSACDAYPGLIKLMRGSGQYHLGAPTQEELEQMIRLPARAAGLDFEMNSDGIGLDSTLLADCSGSGVLPLLSFTLEDLYAKRTPEGLLTYDAYRQLGGLEGAITQRATEEFSKVSESSRAALPDLLASLIALRGEESETASTKTASWAYIVDQPARADLVEAFVRARLLTVEDDPGSGKVVRLAHDALLTQWREARAWVAANRDFLVARARIVTAARYWDSEQRNPALLLPEGKLLEHANSLLLSSRADIGKVVAEFIEVSRAEHLRRREVERVRRHEERVQKLRVRMGYAAGAVGLVVVGFLVVALVRAVARDRAESEGRAKQQAETVVAKEIQNAQLLLASGNYLDAAGRVLRTLRANQTISDDTVARANAVLNEAVYSRPGSVEVAGATEFVPGTNFIWSEVPAKRLVQVSAQGELISLEFDSRPVFSQSRLSFIAPQAGELQLWSETKDGRISKWRALGRFGSDALFSFSADDRAIGIVTPSGARVLDIGADFASSEVSAPDDRVADMRVFSPSLAVVWLVSGRTAIWRRDARPNLVTLTVPVRDRSSQGGGRAAFETRIVHADQVGPAALLTTDRDGRVALWSTSNGNLVASYGNSRALKTERGFLLATQFAVLDINGSSAAVERTYLTRSKIRAFAGAASGEVAVVTEDNERVLWRPLVEAPVVSSLGDLKLGDGAQLQISPDGSWQTVTYEDRCFAFHESSTPSAPLECVAGLGGGDSTVVASPVSTEAIVLGSRSASPGPRPLKFEEPLRPLAIDRRGALVALESAGSNIQVWSVAQAIRRAQFPLSQPVIRADFSLDGSRLLVQTAAGARVWDFGNTGTQREWELDEPIVAADALQTGLKLAAAHGSTVALRDHGRHIEHKFREPVSGLRFSADGSLLVASFKGGKIRVLNAVTLGQVATLSVDFDADQLVVTSGANRIVAWRKGVDEVRVWQRAGNWSAYSLIHWSGVDLVAVREKDFAVLTATVDGSIDLWDGASGAHLRSESTDATIEHVTFVDDVPVIYARGKGDVMTLSDRNMPVPLRLAVSEKDFLGAALSYDGRLAAIMKTDGTVSIVDATSAAEVKRIDLGQQDARAPEDGNDGSKSASGAPSGKSRGASRAPPLELHGKSAKLAFSPSGNLLAIQPGSNQPIYVFDALSGARMARTAAVLEFSAFDIDGETLIARDAKGATSYMNSSTGSPIRPPGRVQQLLYSGDLKVEWPLGAMQGREVFPDPQSPRREVPPLRANRILALRPNGSSITESSTGEIRVFNAATNQSIVAAAAVAPSARVTLAADESAILVAEGKRVAITPIATQDLQLLARELLATH